jgi:hypothetical protein
MSRSVKDAQVQHQQQQDERDETRPKPKHVTSSLSTESSRRTPPVAMHRYHIVWQILLSTREID